MPDGASRSSAGGAVHPRRRRRSRRSARAVAASSAAKAFFRLWIAQVVSSLGDWIGLIAILAIAAQRVRTTRAPRSAS